MRRQAKDKETKEGKKRHTITDRIDLRGYLQKGLSMDEIAKRLGKVHSNIVGGIARHRTGRIGSVKKECSLLRRKYLVYNQCPNKG